jgi:DNA replication regulator SLD3
MGTEPVVLIARLDDDRSLFAVEREDRGLYVICKLGSWVNVRELRARATVLRQDGLDTTGKAFHTRLAVEDSAAITSVDPPIFSKKKRLAIEAIQSMVKRPSIGLLPESQSELAVADGTGQSNSQEGFEVPSAPEHVEHITTGEAAAVVVPQPSASEILENIRTQYFDALYLSKVINNE